MIKRQSILVLAIVVSFVVGPWPCESVLADCIVAWGINSYGADLSCDGVVDFRDFAVFAEQWLREDFLTQYWNFCNSSFVRNFEAGMTTYYVEPNGTGVSTDPANPGGLNDSWDDMCAGTTVGTGDVIQLADGTYDNTTNDVPVVGLGDCTQNIDLTIQSESGDPELCIIDFSGNNAGVDGFHITSTGVWTFNGLTIHGQKSSAQANITFIDGTLNVRNCIIHSGSGFGVATKSDSVVSVVYLYNCEIYNTLNNAVHSDGTAGNASDRIVEAHYCYFHDITAKATPLALCRHDGGVIKAYFCTFENIGHGTPKTAGIAVGYSTGPGSTYVYKCVFKDVYRAVQAVGGGVEVKNCYIESKSYAVCSLGGTETNTIENCLIKGGNLSATVGLIHCNQTSDLIIRNCAIWCEGDHGYVIAGELSSGDHGITLIFEDNLVYYPSTNDSYILEFAGDWNFRRNLIWMNGDAFSNNGIFRNDDTGNVTMNFEHNCIHKGGTDNIWYCTGTDTYTGGYNTVDGGTTWATGITAKATDKFTTVDWCGDALKKLINDY